MNLREDATANVRIENENYEEARNRLFSSLQMNFSIEMVYGM